MLKTWKLSLVAGTLMYGLTYYFSYTPTPEGATVALINVSLALLAWSFVAGMITLAIASE